VNEAKRLGVIFGKIAGLASRNRKRLIDPGTNLP
jgi:hypothetical protein